LAATTCTVLKPDPVEPPNPSFDPTERLADPGPENVHVSVAPWFAAPGPLAEHPGGMPQKNCRGSPSASFPDAVKVTAWPTVALAGPPIDGAAGAVLASKLCDADDSVSSPLSTVSVAVCFPWETFALAAVPVPTGLLSIDQSYVAAVSLVESATE
jgi:hypothetical protein